MFILCLNTYSISIDVSIIIILKISRRTYFIFLYHGIGIRSVDFSYNCPYIYKYISLKRPFVYITNIIESGIRVVIKRSELHAQDRSSNPEKGVRNK